MDLGLIMEFTTERAKQITLQEKEVILFASTNSLVLWGEVLTHYQMTKF